MKPQTQMKRLQHNLQPVHYKSLSVKEADVDKRKVSGYLSVFGVKDFDSDIIIKGAFSKSIKDRGPESSTNGKIAFLWQHDMTDPIGKFTELKEDSTGLYFEAELDEGVPSADRALIQLKSGSVNQFSIGYQYVWDKMEYDEDEDAFIVKEVNLFEGSVVTLGANAATYFAGMKSEQKKQAEIDLIKETEVLIKELPKELQYKARQIISKNIALATSQPAKPLKEEIEPLAEKSMRICNGCLKQFEAEDDKIANCPGCGKFVASSTMPVDFDLSKLKFFQDIKIN